MELTSWRIIWPAVAERHDADWVTQQARNLLLEQEVAGQARGLNRAQRAWRHLRCTDTPVQDNGTGTQRPASTPVTVPWQSGRDDRDSLEQRGWQAVLNDGCSAPLGEFPTPVPHLSTRVRWRQFVKKWKPSA
jgi:hypothetical protein